MGLHTRTHTCVHTEQEMEHAGAWALFGAWHPSWHQVKGVGKLPGLGPLTQSQAPQAGQGAVKSPTTETNGAVRENSF